VERLLQQFEQPVTDRSGIDYRVYVYGRSRPADTWQGWLVFERVSDGARFATDVETTQTNSDAILYWATGLTDAYFGGALDRAMKAATPAPVRPVVPIPPPLVGEQVDATIRLQRLGAIERDVLGAFTKRGAVRVLTQSVLDELPYAHADVVRAFEDLEKRGGLLIRRTEEGNDWLLLTELGASVAEVRGPSAELRPA
jgi:hypothetical protein